jgi:hypothetical protein
MEKKIYCGNGKKVNAFVRGVSICLDDIPAEFITVAKNGKKYVKVDIVDLKEANQWGKDVSCEVNTWKPNSQPKRGETYSYHKGQVVPPENFKDDSNIPF